MEARTVDANFVAQNEALKRENYELRDAAKALALPAPAAREALTAEASATGDAVGAVQAMQIETADDLAYASELLLAAAARWRELEGKRTAITRPMNDAKRAVDALFAPVLSPLKAIETTLREKIASFHTRQAERQVQAMAELAASGEGALVVPAIPAPGVSVREMWGFTVEDANAVPDRFWSIDPEKVKAHMLLADTERTPPVHVPGIKFFRQAAVTVRTR